MAAEGAGAEVSRKSQCRSHMLSPSYATSALSSRYQRKRRADLHFKKASRPIIFALSFLAASSIATSRNLKYPWSSSSLLVRSAHLKDQCVKVNLPISCNFLCLGSDRPRRRGGRIDSSNSMDDYHVKGSQNQSTEKDNNTIQHHSPVSSFKQKSEVIMSDSVEKNYETKTTRDLVFWENMVCGAVSRSVAQVAVHPMNTMKTILQNSHYAASYDHIQKVTFRALAHPSNWRLLTRGAGAQLILSLPHGAINYAVLEFVRSRMNTFVDQLMKMQKNSDGSRTEKRFSLVKPLLTTVTGPGLDFFSSCISTVCTSVISAPQSMITDSIMAGVYPNLPHACIGIMKQGKGIRGFYVGMWPSLVGRIPSYALTETVFEQLKRTHLAAFHRPPTEAEHSIMGCIAAVTAVFVMLPMDTIKTRINTSSSAGVDPYKGIIDATWRIAHEEGYAAFYKGMTPRLISVVPMIGIQFGLKEYMKKLMLQRPTANNVVHFSPPQPSPKPWISFAPFLR